MKCVYIVTTTERIAQSSGKKQQSVYLLGIQAEKPSENDFFFPTDLTPPTLKHTDQQTPSSCLPF